MLDNDRVTADLKRQLEREVGHERQERYWAIFEELRAELGYTDYFGALQRYRSNYPYDQRVLTVSEFLLHYRFANRLFPNSLDAVEYVKQLGTPVILSDGDVVFRPHKIHDSGLFKVFDGAVLITFIRKLNWKMSSSVILRLDGISFTLVRPLQETRSLSAGSAGVLACLVHSKTFLSKRAGRTSALPAQTPPWKQTPNTKRAISGSNRFKQPSRGKPTRPNSVASSCVRIEAI